MNSPVFNQRLERVIARLYGEQLHAMPAAEALGAVLAVASGFHPYEEARNPYLPGDANFIPFKQGWQLAVYNRPTLERIA
jgi:hypothetical protein